MRIMRILSLFGILASCALLGPRLAQGRAGLASRFGEVFIENLLVGHTYNTRELAKMPLVVVNTGDRTVDLKMEILSPREEELIKGYDIIPSTSWVSLGSNLFTLDPGQSAVTDVIISIPDEDRYLGKRYEVFIWSYTVGGGFIGAGLKHKLLFTIAPARGEISQEKVESLKGNLNFSVLPHHIHLGTVKAGKRYELGKLLGKPIRLVNPNSRKFTYRLSSIPVRKSLIKLAEGYEEGPPEFLSFKARRGKVPVRAESIKRLKVYLKFPDREDYRGKKYMFLMHTVVTDQPVEVGVYNDIFVATEE